MTFIQEITPDFLRWYFLPFGEKHNPGGVHGAYRTLRAFFQWIWKEEAMATDGKNPMLKVKAPKVVLDPLEPISIQDVRVLINTGQRGNFIGEWDRAIFLFLLDTGAGAREAYNMNIKDVFAYWSGNDLVWKRRQNTNGLYRTHNKKSCPRLSAPAARPLPGSLQLKTPTTIARA